MGLPAHPWPCRAIAPIAAAFVFLVCCAIPAHVAEAQIVSNYSLLDTSWGLDFTTNGNAQTGWLVTSGDVAGTNVCRIHPRVDHRAGRIVVVAVIDNLMKGACGQAVQNMNLMLGLPEGEGLL